MVRPKIKNSNKINITTWNINSVRKRLNSIDKFLKEFAPDILMLQETKVRNELFPFQFFIYLNQF
jgi:exodeoxyribonuclease-3